MGGTGLEPVTPSLSSQGGRSRAFAAVRLAASLSQIERSIERPSEPERTAILAILATVVGLREQGGRATAGASYSAPTSTRPWRTAQSAACVREVRPSLPRMFET
jgi:hypothetical protein